jgi:hypothetical protein
MKRISVSFVAILMFVFSNMAFGEESKAEFPLGYPWSSWGEVSEEPVGHQEKGLKIDGYAEQGVDWFKLGKTGLIFNTFAGIRGTASGRKSDYYNNRVGPWAGLKFKEIFNFGQDNSGSLYLGVRWEYYHYLGSAPPVRDDNRVVFFLEWGFDGDWKKKNNNHNNNNHNNNVKEGD